MVWWLWLVTSGGLRLAPLGYSSTGANRPACTPQQAGQPRTLKAPRSFAPLATLASWPQWHMGRRGSQRFSDGLSTSFGLLVGAGGPSTASGVCRGLRPSVHGSSSVRSQRPDGLGLASDDGGCARALTTAEGYRNWAATYDLQANQLIDMEQPIVRGILDRLPPGTALDAACGTGRHAAVLAVPGPQTWSGSIVPRNAHGRSDQGAPG